MSHKECRDLILNRLRERDQYCGQFERIIKSYQNMVTSMQNLIVQNSRLMATGGGGRRPTSTSNFSGTGESSQQDLDELEALRTKLDDISRQKAVNDQQLIDAKNRLEQIQTEMRQQQMECDTALHKVQTLKEELEHTKAEVRRLKEDNQCLLDEHIALQAAYSSIEHKWIEADKERAELINRMKEFKEREISLINDMNEREQQIQLQRMRCELAEAARPNPAIDARAFEMLGMEEAQDAGSSGMAGRERVQSFGDIIPSTCRVKFECNELGEVNDVRFHPNGKFFFTAGTDKRIKMWEPGSDTCAKRAEFTGANQGVTRIDINQEASYILGSSNDFAVRVWSLEDQRQRFAFTGHSDKVTTAKFFNAGQRIVSGSNDRTIKIWDIATNRCQHTFFPGSIICDLATNDRCGAPLISAHFDKSVRFWDTRTRVGADSTVNMVKFGAKVTSLYLTSDSMYLLCSARDETLTLLDLRNTSTLHVYSAEQYRTSSDYSRAVISPGDSFVAAGSADGHIFVWNLHTTRLEKVLFKGGHENAAVLSLAWHPAGYMLLSGDKRKTVCLWR